MVRQIPALAQDDTNAEIWQAVRALVESVNEIRLYLDNLALSYGAFDADYSEAVVTSSGVWDPIDVTFDPGFPEFGFDIVSGSRITPTHSMGRGFLDMAFIASNLSNNRTHLVGLRLDGDDGTIDPIVFQTLPSGSTFTFNGLIVTEAVTVGSYVELVVSSTTAESWNIDGSIKFSVVTAALLPGDTVLEL